MEIVRDFFQISGQQGCILDMVLRWVKRSEAYMGGVRNFYNILFQFQS